MRHPQAIIVGKQTAQYEIGPTQNFVYFVLDWIAKEALIIDPHSPLQEPLQILQKNHFKLSQILLTHTHYDHVDGVPELVKWNPDIKILTHKDEFHRVQEYGTHIHFIQDGDELHVGAIKIKVLHTPGHSAGECSYFIQGTPPHLFTGDTLFIRDCGRTDLPTGSTEQMFYSLQKIRALPPETVILPGHHYKKEYASVLSEELLRSPPFQCKSVAELEALP